MAKIILIKDKVGIPLPDFKTYCKATPIKQCIITRVSIRIEIQI